MYSGWALNMKQCAMKMKDSREERMTKRKKEQKDTMKEGRK